MRGLSAFLQPHRIPEMDYEQPTSGVRKQRDRKYRKPGGQLRIPAKSKLALGLRLGGPACGSHRIDDGGTGCWRRSECSRPALRKGIANDFNKATAFCNAPTRVNSAAVLSLHKRPFVQASDLSNHQALPRRLFRCSMVGACFFGSFQFDCDN